MRWIEIDNTSHRGDTIIAISSDGQLRLRNGVIRLARYRDCVRINGQKERIYRVIAEYFLPKTEEDVQLGRTCIDHITHTPTDMNINDVRNLRWCTVKENNNFDEARSNKSSTMKGKSPWNKGMHGAAYTDHYKDGVKNQFTCTREG